MEALLEIPPESVTMQSKLYEDLDIDSIDAIDLVVRFQTLIKQKIPPEEFKAVRTVEDVVNCIHALLEK